MEFKDCSEVQLIEAFAALEKKLDACMGIKEESTAVRILPIH